MSSLFFGEASVRRARDLKRDYGGKLGSATLTKSDGSGTVTYANAYVWPRDEQTGLGRDGSAVVTGTVTIYRLGESDRPRSDDQLEAGGFDLLLTNVKSRLNDDESRGYGVYDCRYARAGTSAG